MRRIEQGVERQAAIRLEIDGAEVQVHPGETVAVAVLAAQTLRFRDDRSGRARGMFCNMGTCGECTVWIANQAAGGGWKRQRACLTPVAPGMNVSTTEPETGHD